MNEHLLSPLYILVYTITIQSKASCFTNYINIRSWQPDLVGQPKHNVMATVPRGRTLDHATASESLDEYARAGIVAFEATSDRGVFIS